jgi:hypothetical protein
MEKKNLPIGYWIKLADELLTGGINKIQASLKVTRTEWQVLNLINERPFINKSDLIAILEPFADTGAIEVIFSRFAIEGLIIAENDEILELTEKGHVLYELCASKQQTFRQKAMAGISDEEYRATIVTLQKIVANIKVSD